MTIFPAEKIIKEVSAKHDVTPAEIKGRSRLRHIYAARVECCVRISRELGYSTTRIGRILGGRDHTTIIHTLNKSRLERTEMERRKKLMIEELGA